MGIETVIGLGLGAAGLLQNADASRRQSNAMGDANALNWEALNFQKDQFKKYSEPGLQALLALASGYDPIAESRASTDHASTVAQDAITRALHGFNASMGAAGAQSGQSSLEGAQRAAVMKPVAQQLAGIVADATSNATAKKANMWQALLGQAPAGQLGQSYFSAAGNLAQMASAMPQGNFGGSAQLISQLLGQLFKPAGGAGGAADNRYAGWNGSTDTGQSQVGRSR